MTASDAVSEAPLPRRPLREEPREFHREVNHVTLAGFEWPGDGDPILMTHGTGFHARVWDEVARLLPGRRVISVDLRGHGRSSKPEGPYHWSHFAEDIAHLVDDLDLRRVIGVGHSMGGHTIIDAAIRRPERFAALVLVDPTIFSAAAQGRRQEEDKGRLDFVKKRRNEWESPDEMIERFRTRFPFSEWHPQTLRDYAVHGLLPAGEEVDGYVLACPPHVEAQVYGGRDPECTDVLGGLHRVQIPVRVLRARRAEPGEKPPPFAVSVTAPALTEKLPAAVDVELPHLSHFIPMEAPDVVARHVIEVVEEVS